MNSNELLEKIQPYIVNDRISRKDVNSLFGSLPASERKKIEVQIIESDIEIVTDVYQEDIFSDDNEEHILEEEYVDDIFDDFPDESDDEDNDLKYIDHSSDDARIDKNKNKEIHEQNEYWLSRYRQGDPDALSIILENNKNLVWAIVKKYSRNSRLLESEDLFQVGMMGLMKAIEKYDLSRGTKFSTYAIWWIRQSITRDICDNGSLIRIPVHAFEKINKYSHLEKQYWQEGLSGSEIVKKIAKEDGVDIDRVYYLLAIRDKYLSTTSLDSEIGLKKDTILSDIIPSPEKKDILTIMSEKQYIDSVLVQLKDREKIVIKERFGFSGDCKTLEELGQELGITRERVRQIESKALERIRGMKQTKQLSVEWNYVIPQNTKKRTKK